MYKVELFIKALVVKYSETFSLLAYTFSVVLRAASSNEDKGSRMLK